MRAFVVSVALLGLASCILFVSPKEYGDHCRFKSDDSACGSCMASKCQETIDACCRDDACTPTLAQVEQCAAGALEVCSGIVREESAAASTRVALAACFVEKCQGTCRAGAPTNTITQCTAPAFGRGQTCTCIVSGTPNQTACDEATFANTMCCAPLAWPGPALRCSCRAFDCRPSSDGCSCALQDGVSEGTLCTGPICCLDHDVCTCGSRPCLAQDQVVSTCNFASIGCALGQKHVASCAVAATK